MSRSRYSSRILTGIVFICSTLSTNAQNADQFGFFGYMRSGFGIDGKGGPLDVFQAPNSEAKYRLGNEAEAYIEALFRYAFQDEENTLFETNLRLAFVSPTSKSNQFITTTSVREAYVRSQGLIKNMTSLSFWAGQRFYDRYDVHLNDFWYRDMSGFGGGFEDLMLGESLKLSLAFLGGSIDQLTSNGTVLPTNEFGFNKTTLDLSLYDINIGFGTLGLTFDFSNFTGDSVADDTDYLLVESSRGVSFGIFHEKDIRGGRNRLMLFYGTGAAENYKAIIQQPLGIMPASGETIEVPDFRRFRVVNDLQVDINSKFSLLGLLIYQQLRNGQAFGDKLDWISAGLRPAYHFSRYFSLVGEFGLDYTSQKDFDDGMLFKMTIAPQISPLNKILSRPALRAYFTYAKWSDAYVGSIAANSFPDQDYGISIGIQMEVWW